MEKQLKDYLHLYLGCECKGDEGSMVYTLIDVGLERSSLLLDRFGNECVIFDFKPILRPLSDMTEEEMQECGNMIYDFSDEPDLNKWQWKDFEIGLAPEQFHWLLSKCFDLFGLIDAGLAIDKTKVSCKRDETYFVS